MAYVADQYLCCTIKEGKLQEELEAEEREEEEEAKNIQNRLAANLSEEDYDLSFFQVFLLFKKLFLTHVIIPICIDKIILLLFFLGV